MKKELHLGTIKSTGKPFTLPLNFATRTLALIAMRGAGKTIAATDIAEEMCEAGLPWCALDPVGVWWGLRVNPDGSPGGYPIVILGGEHADLEFDRNMGRQVADAIVQENVSCVIDLSSESKTVWRKFVADFCDRLMELRPAVPRHIFIEEAPEFVPQKPMGEQRRSLAAVDRLIRLGRNRGYGATLISQRMATIQKDVLTQCESLLALRSIGKPDRRAAQEWIAECVSGTEAKMAEKFLASLTKLPDGQGWFWSPQWLKVFYQVKLRLRKTYHPGETRSVGQAPKQVTLSNVHDFVERFKGVLTRPAPPSRQPRGPHKAKGAEEAEQRFEQHGELHAAREEATQLRAQVAELHRQAGQANAVLTAVRKVMEPDYKMLQRLFGELESHTTTGEDIDTSVFEPWKKKLGAGPAKLIDCLIERGGELTRTQLQTLSGYGARSMTNHIARLNTNGLIEKEGSIIRLRVP